MANPDPYASYQSLTLHRHPDGILEIVMGEEGKLAVATANAHAEMARIWLDIDRDPVGAGKHEAACLTHRLVEADDHAVARNPDVLNHACPARHARHAGADRLWAVLARAH